MAKRSRMDPLVDPVEDDGDAGGLASVVLVQAGDDLAAICGRVDTAPTFAVVVHAPRGNRQLSTELGIRRLQRHADESGRVVAIATRNGALQARARQAGIPVARKPEWVRWDKGGKRGVGIGRYALFVPNVGGVVQAIVLLAVFAAMAGLLLTMGPKATVAVTPSAETIAQTVLVTASPDRTEIDLAKRFVPAQKVSSTQTITLAVPTTGKAPVGVAPAKALVTITNPGSKDVKVPARAIVLAQPDSQPFEIDLETAVPAGKSVTQQASAQRPGVRGNVAAGTLTSWLDPQLRALTVTNGAPAAGGADEQRRAVDAKDVVSIKALADELVKSDAVKTRLVVDRPHDAIFLGTAEASIETGTPEPAAGAPADLLMLEVKVTVTALAVTGDTLDALARALLVEGQGPGELVPGSVSAVETGARQVNAADGTITTELRVAGLFARGVTRDGIRDAVKGKRANAAESTLVERYGIQNPEVNVSPSWVPWVPRFGFRIGVTVRGAETPAAAGAPAVSADAPAPSPTPVPTASANPRP